MLPVRRKKTNNDFVTFASPEAVDMIWNYLEKVREIERADIEKYLEKPLFTALKNTWRGGQANITSLTNASIDRIFRDIAKRIDVAHTPQQNEQGNWIYGRYHPHLLRKFFNTEMKDAGAPEYAVEFMMGHLVDRTRATYYFGRSKRLKGNLHQIYARGPHKTHRNAGFSI